MTRARVGHAFHTRPEHSEDRDAIQHVIAAAFGRRAEADLVDRLRIEAPVVASLVAVADGAIVGHALFSGVRVGAPDAALHEGGAWPRVASLAPLAVRPDAQRQGIGAALVRAGIHACADAGCVGVIVVGDPGYYERFGFAHATVAHLANPYAGDAFMGLDLTPHALGRISGRVMYPAAFEAL